MSAGVVGVTVIGVGSYGLLIQTSGPFGPIVTTKTTSAGLNAAEQLLLLPVSQLLGLLGQ